MVMEFLKTFNGLAAAKAWISRRASRQVGEFLDGFGKEKVKKCIQDGVWITDFIPPEYKVGLKEKTLPYRDLLDAFPNEEAYLWIPEGWRLYFESFPNGKKYALAQLQVIREFLLA